MLVGGRESGGWVACKRQSGKDAEGWKDGKSGEEVSDDKVYERERRSEEGSK